MKHRGVNILVTGTPGVGKSYFCNELSHTFRLRWLDISKAALEYSWLITYDELYKCPILDEEKLISGMEYDIKCGKNVVDYHSCSVFPENWFDLIIVLRTDPDVLFDRLKHKGYTDKMIENIVKIEMKNVVLGEALRCFPNHLIREFRNVNHQDINDNIDVIRDWLTDWKFNRL